MSEKKWYRDHRRIRNKEEGEDGISKYIFESWSPALSKHLLEYRHKSSCDDRPELWSRIFEHIESYRVFLIGRIEEDDIIGSRFWNISKDCLDKIAMRIDDGDTTPASYIGRDHIFEKRRLSHTSLSDNIDVSSSVDRLESEFCRLSTIVCHSNWSIWWVYRREIVWRLKSSCRHPVDSRSFHIERWQMDNTSKLCGIQNACCMGKFFWKGMKHSLLRLFHRETISIWVRENIHTSRELLQKKIIWNCISWILPEHDSYTISKAFSFFFDMFFFVMRIFSFIVFFIVSRHEKTNDRKWETDRKK